MSHKQKLLNLLFGNIRGLYSQTNLSKPSILLDLAEYKQCSIISIVETHLKPDITNNETTREGWNVFRADRSHCSGGGAAIYVNNDHIISDEIIFSSDMCELLGIYLTKSDLAVISIYRPPGCNTVDFSTALNKIRSWLIDLES